MKHEQGQGPIEMARHKTSEQAAHLDNGPPVLTTEAGTPMAVHTQQPVQAYVNGSGPPDHNAQTAYHSRIVRNLERWGPVILAGLFAAGFLMQPATKSSVDELGKKIDTLVNIQTEQNKRLKSIEETNGDWRVWAAHVEEKIDRLSGAPPTPLAPVTPRRIPTKKKSSWPF